MMISIFVKLKRFLLFFLFFSLPLIHTKLFDTLWFPLWFSVNGNFEFTKVIFFQVISSIILSIFICEKVWKKEAIILPQKIFFLLLSIIFILFISSFTSLSPYISFFWNGDKSHSFFMFTNLIGIYILLLNTEKKVLKRLVYTSLVSLLFVWFVAVKEYFFPTFNYGNLANRAIGTFWHPNYLSLFFLLFFPFLARKKKYFGLLGFSFLVLLLTKSFLGITLWVLYLGYSFIKKYPKYTKKWFFISLVISFSLILFLWLQYFPVEKLHSFISRFYIWETTLRIIFSDWKIFLLGGGFETLDIYFNSFKSPYLYIFENFWFTADRPHNFFLNIFYHTGVFGLWIFIYILSCFFKHIYKKWWWKYEEAFILFLLFSFFNYPSVSIYLVLMLLVSLFYKKYPQKNIDFVSVKIFSLWIVIFSLIGSLSSFSLYKAEAYAHNGNYEQAKQFFPLSDYFYKLWESTLWKNYDSLPSENFYLSNITHFRNIPENCTQLTVSFPSIENYFYCGKVLELLWKEHLSTHSYHTWLQKLPDLWNTNSLYWKNSLVKKSISGNRFFSKKFSDIKEILEKQNIKKPH